MINEWIMQILEIILSSGIICGALLLFRKLFKKHVSPRVVSALWLVLIVRLLIPITLDVPLHLPFASSLATWEAAEQHASEQTPGLPEASAAVGAAEKESAESRIADNIHKPIRDLSAASEVSASLHPEKKGMQSGQTYFGVVPAAGTAVLLLWICVRALRQRKWYARHERPVPLILRNAAIRAARECGLRHIPRVRMIEGLATPGLTISLRPSVVVPAALVHPENKEQLHFALLHELTHFRHGDHLTSLIMQILQAIWWFNPFAWVGFAVARRDMETACDCTATRTLDKPERAKYARMLIDLASGMLPAPDLGLTRSARTKIVEARIRHLYGNRRTGICGKVAAVALCAILAVTCFTTACHPVPAAHASAMQQDTALAAVPPDPTSSPSAPSEAEVSEGPLPYVSGGRWEEDVQLSDGVRLVADLDMMLPDTDAFPIERLIPRDITQEDADALIRRLAGEDAVILSTRQPPTRPDLEQKIVEMQQLAAEYRAQDDDAAADDIESGIESVEELLSKAPDTAVPIPADTHFAVPVDPHTGTEYEDAGYLEIRVLSESPEGDIAEIRASRPDPAGDGNWRGSSFSYSEGVQNCEAWDSTQAQTLASARAECENRTEPEWADWTAEQMRWIEETNKDLHARASQYAKNTIDLENAKERARALLEELDIEGLELTMCSRGLLQRFESTLDTDPDRQFGHSLDPDQSEDVVVLEFLRASCGIPGTWADGNIGGTDTSAQYAPRISMEQVKMVLDKDGEVRAFSWSDPVRADKTVAENSTILAPKDISQRAMEPLSTWVLQRIEGSLVAEQHIPATCTVEEMRLTAAYAPDQDDPDALMLVPVWEITAQLSMDEEPAVSQEKTGGCPLSLDMDFGSLYISALDGTILLNADYAS